MEDNFNEIVLKAHARSFQRAFETAVRTGTALIYSRNGKIVEIRPPYEYKLVRKKTSKKRKSSPRRHEGS